MYKHFLALAAAAGLCFPVHADTIAQWNFESPLADLSNSAVSPLIAATTGAGTALGSHASNATDWTTPVGNGSANSLSSNTWATGDFYEFSFSTIGYESMLLSFDQISSSTGPTSFSLTYSADGGVSFATHSSYAVLTTPSWSSVSPNVVHSKSFDLSAVTALDDQASVVLRLVSNVTPAAGGTSRIDNFTVAMAPVPEPETYALMLAGLGVIGAMARRRRG